MSRGKGALQTGLVAPLGWFTDEKLKEPAAGEATKDKTEEELDSLSLAYPLPNLLNYLIPPRGFALLCKNE